MAYENNTQSGWTKVTKERHSQACLAQRRCMFLRGRSLTKISLGLFFVVWLVPSKTVKLNHPPRKIVPIRYYIMLEASYMYNYIQHELACPL